MSLSLPFENPFCDAIHWHNPHPELLSYKFVAQGDSIRTLSRLIIGPGQGALLVYDGVVEEIITKQGAYNIAAGGEPFSKTLRKVIQSAYDENNTGIWFFRTSGTNHCHWSTMSVARYLDPENKFPDMITAFGQYSMVISNAARFFTKIIQKDSFYYQNEIRDTIIQHISQPMTRIINKAKLSGVYIDLDKIANLCKLEANTVYSRWGFELTDFKIEGPFLSDYAVFSMSKMIETNS